jgi:hypothetical protein
LIDLANIISSVFLLSAVATNFKIKVVFLLKAKKPHHFGFNQRYLASNKVLVLFVIARMHPVWVWRINNIRWHYVRGHKNPFGTRLAKKCNKLHQHNVPRIQLISSHFNLLHEKLGVIFSDEG